MDLLTVSDNLADNMNDTRNNLVYVLSSQVGAVGGAAKATHLLCEALICIHKQVELFVTLPPEKVVLDNLQTQGIKVHVPIINKGWKWRLPQKLIAFQIFWAARRMSPSLIHSVSLSVEARYLLRLPQVAPLYLWETTEALPHVKFLDREIHKYLSKATAILAPSAIVAKNIRSTYNYTGQIRLLPFWVEPPPPSNSPLQRKRTHNFLYVGRMDPDKGLQYLCEGFRPIQRLYPQATLTVCGGGDAKPIQELAQNDPMIEVRGYISQAEYEKAIEHCDAVVLPSLHEGYPLSLLEACARSKPIIATTVGSIPEVFKDRPCALIVPPQDATALTQAMLKLLEEEDELYQQRCLDARQRFEEVSSPPIIEAHLRQAYAPSSGDVHS